MSDATSATPAAIASIPRCVMEAMAAGVAVVASDIPGCRDVIEHGRTGLLFPLDDVRALAICLERCLDPMFRARMTEAARDLVVARYSAAAMAREYQDLYAQLLAAPLRRAHVPQAR